MIVHDRNCPPKSISFATPSIDDDTAALTPPTILLHRPWTTAVEGVDRTHRLLRLVHVPVSLDEPSWGDAGASAAQRPVPPAVDLHGIITADIVIAIETSSDFLEVQVSKVINTTTMTVNGVIDVG